MTLSAYQMQTNTKICYSNHKNSPELKNEYGSLNNLLKIVMTEGYNEQVVQSASLDPVSNIAKLILDLDHGFNKDVVVEITSTDAEGLTGEFRILSKDLAEVEIFIPETLRSKTLTNLTIKIAPLGYSIAFEDLDKGVLCLANTSRIPFILKSIDSLPPNDYAPTWSKFSRVVIGQKLDILGEFVNEEKAPYHPDYPQSEKTGNGIKGSGGIHGFAKWDYVMRSDSYEFAENKTVFGVYPTDWKIIGDSKTFYLMIRPLGRNNRSYNVLSFGEYTSYNPEEFKNACLTARDDFSSAESIVSANFARTRQCFGVLESSYTGFILSDIYGNIKNTVDYNRFRNAGAYFSGTEFNRPWKSPDINSIHPITGEIFLEKLYIMDRQNFLRGFHRGMTICYGEDRFANENPTSAGIFSISVQEPNTTSTYLEMPIIFYMGDWD